MNSTKFENIIKTIDLHSSSLTGPQFIKLAECVLQRYPLVAIDYFTITNYKNPIQVGFRKPEGVCPFCKYDLNGKKKKGVSS